MAEMSLLGKSKSNPNRTRINKEVYDDPEVRSKMQSILQEVSEEHKGPREAVNIWEKIKTRAFEMLIQETKIRKKKANQPINAEIANLEDTLSYMQTSKTLPTPEREEGINAITVSYTHLRAHET